MSETSPQEPGGGFTVQRRLHGTAERVFAAFVEPSNLEQWFVLPGCHTPANACESTPARAGGLMR